MTQYECMNSLQVGGGGAVGGEGRAGDVFCKAVTADVHEVL